MPILAGISPGCAVRSAETQLLAHMHPTTGAVSDVGRAAAGEGGGSIEEGDGSPVLLFDVHPRLRSGREKQSLQGFQPLAPFFPTWC